ncbi:MAG: serine/threonine-protein kinase [Candidatus Sericytochromatia bacterium]
MAELRTIEKSLDIEMLSVSGSILSLPDDYIVIPHLLYNSRKFHDYVVTVIGPNGFFLISYQAFFDRHFINENIEDAMIYLREYTIKLSDYMKMRNIRLDVPPKLIIAVEDSFINEIQGEEDDVRIVPLSKIKNLIIASYKKELYSKSKVSEIVFSIRANGLLKRINQYQLLNEIEISEAYCTYMAYDTITDKTVLIKEVKNYTDSSKIEDLEKNEVLREAKLTMQLKHENIISIEQIIPRDNSLYIIVEWIDGAKNLRQMINSNRHGFSVEITKVIINQICAALEHCHAKGIVHRNIRPENILITQDYLVKITNFDLAKKADVSTRSTFDIKQMLKENPYAAPELRLASSGPHNIDTRVDIYSVGVIMYEFLTNRLPYHLDERYWEPPSKFNDQVNDSLDKICLKAIRFDQHQRFGTISAMRDKLNNLDNPIDELSTEKRYVDREIYKRTPNSIIYQAYDNKIQKNVALKKVLFDKLFNSEQRKQKLFKLLSEAQIISKLDHENIVKVHDCFIEDGDGYIVMEWLNGQTLREYKATSQQLSVEEILKIGIQIAKSLDYAHNQSIVHKDIKPENIMYHDGKITILDFGLASFLESKTPEKSYGTPMYMAPEQIKGNKNLDQRVDIFSLGVLIYELLSNNEYPYTPDIIMSGYSENFEPIPLNSRNYIISTELDMCIKKAIKINPDERYQKIADFISELDNILNSGNIAPKIDYIKKFRMVFDIPKLFILLMIIILLSLSIVKMIQFEKKETLELNNVNITTPAIPMSFSFDKSDINSYDWISDKSKRKDTIIEMRIKVNHTLKQSTFILNVKNLSNDKIELFNLNNLSKLITIKDNLGNEYNNKIMEKTISPEITKINPNSEITGSFIIETLPHQKADKIDLRLKEYNGKQRSFFVSFEKN